MQTIRLLLVEGDMTIADILGDALADAGYKVVRAADGAEGAELLEDEGDEIRGLIADVDLASEPNGWTLARSAREKRPQMAVVYTAEHGADDWRVKGVPTSLMVAKPYAVGQIVTAIASLLNQAASASGVSSTPA